MSAAVIPTPSKIYFLALGCRAMLSASPPSTNSVAQEDLLPLDLMQAAYTQEGVRAMVQNPQARSNALRAPIESLGGKIHHLFLSFGEYDAANKRPAPDTTLCLRRQKPQVNRKSRSARGTG